jgi:hypothetical protein
VSSLPPETLTWACSRKPRRRDIAVFMRRHYARRRRGIQRHALVLARLGRRDMMPPASVTNDPAGNPNDHREVAVAQKGVVFLTAMTTRQCGEVFKKAAGAAQGTVGKALELIPKAAGGTAGLMQAGFYQPRFDSAFDALDESPTFAVSTQIYGLATAARSGGTPLHMYVFDRSRHREVQLVSAHGLTGGGGSRRVVEKALAVFRAADPALKVTDGNISTQPSAPRAAVVPTPPVVARKRDSGQREHVRCSRCDALNYATRRAVLGV